MQILFTEIGIGMIAIAAEMSDDRSRSFNRGVRGPPAIFFKPTRTKFELCESVAEDFFCCRFGVNRFVPLVKAELRTSQ